MSTEQVNLRLETEMVADLEDLANREALDRPTLMRQLLLDGLRARRLSRAIGDYQNGWISIGRAAEDAGISLWDLMDELHRRLVAHPMTPDDAEERFRAIEQLSERPRGFATQVESDGKVIWTLKDLIPEPGKVLLVGINPAIVSLRAGHYYQGKLGKRLWKRLELIGLLESPIPGEEDKTFANQGHGITDVVKRPTRTADEVTREELQEGAKQLLEKLEEWTPGLMLFAFKPAAEALLRRSVTPGRGPTVKGVPTFLLTGPYAPSEDRQRNDRQLKSLLAKRFSTHAHQNLPRPAH